MSLLFSSSTSLCLSSTFLQTSFAFVLLFYANTIVLLPILDADASVLAPLLDTNTLLLLLANVLVSISILCGVIDKHDSKL